MRLSVEIPNLMDANLTDIQRIRKMQTFFNRLTDELSYCLDNIDMDNLSPEVKTSLSESAKGMSAEEKDSFESVKSLIINTAHTIDVYEDVMEKSLKGEYSADSTFGRYVQETHNDIKANSQGLSLRLTKEQLAEIPDIKYVKELQGIIDLGWTGKDSEGNDLVGIAISQLNSNQKAVFTANKLSFFNGGNEVAYIANESTGNSSSLMIVNATIKGRLDFGGYRITTNNGLAFKWIGV